MTEEEFFKIADEAYQRYLASPVTPPKYVHPSTDTCSDELYDFLCRATEDPAVMEKFVTDVVESMKEVQALEGVQHIDTCSDELYDFLRSATEDPVMMEAFVTEVTKGMKDTE